MATGHRIAPIDENYRFPEEVRQRLDQDAAGNIQSPSSATRAALEDAFAAFDEDGDVVDAAGKKVITVEAANAAYVAGEVTDDNVLGYSPFWKHARVSESPLDRTPVIVPAGGTEGSFVQEPNVWADDTTIHMIYSGGNSGSIYLHHASCPIDADPTIPDNWTKSGVVIGNGEGGEAGTALHAGIYIEDGTIYCYYTTAAGDLDVATASVDDPTTYTHVGTVLTLAESTASILVANAFVVKLDEGDYRLYWEGGGALPLWQIGTARGASPTDEFTFEAFPLDGLSFNPGYSTNSNPFIVEEDGHYTMWLHGAWGRNQRGSGTPTVGYAATSDDGLNWTLLDGGQQTVRLAHRYEVDQVADFTLLEVAGEKYAFWSANNRNNGTGRIMATHVRRGLIRKREGVAELVGAPAPTGPKLPVPYLGSLKLTSSETLTATGSPQTVTGLSYSSVQVPDTVRVIFTATFSVRSSSAGQVSAQLSIPGSTTMLLGQSPVIATQSAAAANQIIPFSLTLVCDIPADKVWNANVQVTAPSGSTVTVFSGGSSFIDTRPLST